MFEENAVNEEVVEDINPLIKIRYASLSGRSKRKMARQNTIRWTGVCLKCGGECRYTKYDPNTEKKDIWVCRNCKSVWHKEDFKDGRYL